MNELVTVLSDGANLAVILAFAGGIFLVIAGFWVDARIDKKLEARLDPIEKKMDDLSHKFDEIVWGSPKRRLGDY